MPAPIIEVTGVGKRYRIGVRRSHYLTAREAITGVFHRMSGGPQDREIWALRDVTLTVAEGETVGIIGRNGAGKTTLLKLLARITYPTEGRIRTRGRVGALLQVGAGFHPELTGRENIFLSGAVLGMSRREIARRFDEIVAFAETERFLDTPLKRYSSGMYLRLGFSVAVHLESNIVMVDEVLAVGDVEYQHRCLSKMGDLSAEGRTVLFVSHDLGAIARVCPRAVWLDRGAVRADGPTTSAVEQYMQEAASETLEVRPDYVADATAFPLSIAVVDGSGRIAERPRRDEALRIRIRFQLREQVPGLDVGVNLYRQNGVRVISDAWSDSHAGELTSGPGIYDACVTVPPILTPGDYTLGVWIGTPVEDFFLDDVLTFNISPRGDDRLDWIRRERVVQPPLRWDLTHVDGPNPAATDVATGPARVP
jgi:ABC-type polysaccharide/polyol phosphate transport system ATPase subunit